MATVNEQNSVSVDEACAIAVGLKTYHVIDEPGAFFILVGDATLARFIPSVIEADAALVAKKLDIAVVQNESGEWVAKRGTDERTGMSLCEAVTTLAVAIGPTGLRG